MKKVKAWWNNLPASTQKIAQLITAITVIGGACASAIGWIESSLTETTNQRIDKIEASLQADKGTTERSLTRIELMLLIQHDPSNTFEIEKVARHYFVDLGGNWYMAALYSDWAATYGGDTSFVKE